MVFVLFSYRRGNKIIHIAFIGFCWYKLFNFNYTLCLPFILCSWRERTWWSRTWSVWRNRQSESWARPRVRGQCVSICLKFGSEIPVVKDSTSSPIHFIQLTVYFIFVQFSFEFFPTTYELPVSKSQKFSHAIFHTIDSYSHYFCLRFHPWNKVIII